MSDPQRDPNLRSHVDAYGLAREVDASPEAAEADEKVYVSRVGIWVFVALIVLVGVALYFMYRGRTPPLLG